MEIPMTQRPRPGLARLILMVSFLGCDAARGEPATPPFEIVAEYPHDTAAYTQGLVWDGDALFESTGRYGYSELRRVDLKTGKVLTSVSLPSNRFGEGLAKLGNRFYQLTWESKVGYVYDAATLAQVDSFEYAGEGWGLTTDGTSLIMSDGSDSLRYFSPADFSTERVIKVRHEGSPLTKVNELEFVDGELLANIYESDWIARIDPVTGAVRELLDFATLYPRKDRPGDVDVMNGIARGPASDQLIVTGKLWPKTFVVRLKKRR
jgi:glutamine cyclotransferase